MTAWDFANNHWFVALLMFYIAAWALVQPFHYAFKSYNRFLRSKNIASQGWPKPPMDADGDVVEDETKAA